MRSHPRAPRTTTRTSMESVFIDRLGVQEGPRRGAATGPTATQSTLPEHAPITGAFRAGSTTRSENRRFERLSLSKGDCVPLKILITTLLTAVAIAPSAAARPDHVPAGRLSGPSATSAACSGAVSWQRARSLVGQRATVRGRVVDSYFARSSSGQPTFLNMGNAYPNPSRFTVLIWRENRGSFGGSPETRFRGRTLCVTGLVQMYGGAPEIIARARTQIRVTG
jgi:hypothetical protein